MQLKQWNAKRDKMAAGRTELISILNAGLTGKLAARCEQPALVRDTCLRQRHLDQTEIDLVTKKWELSVGRASASHLG